MIGKQLAGWLPLRERWLVYGLSLLAGPGTCLLLWGFLTQLQPFGGFGWMDDGMRQAFAEQVNQVFLDYSPYYAGVGIISAFFGLLGHFGKNELLSRSGAWSIAGLGGAFILSSFTITLLGFIFLPVLALALWIAAAVRVGLARRYVLDLLIVPFSVLLCPLYYQFFQAIWSLCGD